MRTYVPSMGRYLEPDPIGQAGSKNVYLYGENNPLIFVDPYGRKLYFIGPRLAGIAGVGGKLGAGFYIGTLEGNESGQGWFGTSFDTGFYGSAGPGVGLELGAGIEVGRVEPFSGLVLNANLSLGLVGGSFIFDVHDCQPSASGNLVDFYSALLRWQGGSFEYGPGFPVGESVTVTKTMTTADLIRAVGRGVRELMGHHGK